MSQEERYGARSRAYSAWHRRRSTRRFVGIEKAQLLAMIDLDGVSWVEYDDQTKEPIILVETARDVGQACKPSTVTRAVAKRCVPVLPAYVVLYTESDQPNPADPDCPDITAFRVKRIWPEPVTAWRTFKPQEWAQMLVEIRTRSTTLLDKALDEVPF